MSGASIDDEDMNNHRQASGQLCWAGIRRGYNVAKIETPTDMEATGMTGVTAKTAPYSYFPRT